MTGLIRLVIMGVLAFIVYRFVQRLFGAGGSIFRNRAAQNSRREEEKRDKNAIDAEFKELD